LKLNITVSEVLVVPDTVQWETAVIILRSTTVLTFRLGRSDLCLVTSTMPRCSPVCWVRRRRPCPSWTLSQSTWR
jgi:hypothetical protein